MTIVGNCPHCGAPIYTPTVWHGIFPPPVHYTCACRGSGQIIENTDGTAYPYNYEEDNNDT